MSSEEKNDRSECDELLEHLATAVEGGLPPALEKHLGDCDDCRLLVRDALGALDSIRAVGDRYLHRTDFAENVIDAIDARATKKKPSIAPIVVDDQSAPAAVAIVREGATTVARPWNRRFWNRWRAGAALSLAAALSLGVIALRRRDAAKGVPGAWKGTVATALVGGGGEGLSIVDDDGTAHPLHKGDAVPPGAHLRSDLKTWARLALEDGTSIVLDRGADVVLDKTASRSAKVLSGSMLLDVGAPSGSSGAAKLKLPGGTLSSNGTKLAISVNDAGTNKTTSIAVAKGTLELQDEHGKSLTVHAGEGVTLGGATLSLSRTAGLASAFSRSELEEVSIAPEASNQALAGFGALRARVPGSTGDGDRPLELAKQHVAIEIAGDIARTEIDETFRSDDPRELEGVFQFPLPPDAKLERLALEVDGHLEEGSFVEKDKGSAIWKGILFTSAQKHAAPGDEWIWIQTKYTDPALLEWRAGGRMELRIFPIPPKGSRRVVLAYTQHVPVSAGTRRYAYPLPQLASSKATVADFALDVKVHGHDLSKGVRVRGYEMLATDEGAVAHRALAKKSFVPTGDVLVEYAKVDEGAVLSSVAYAPKANDSAFVALTLAPTLPALPEKNGRTQVIVVDSSRSMTGERFARATALAARLVEELDSTDRFAVLACDVTCVSFAPTARIPSRAAATEVERFLSTISPDGGSDVLAAIEAGAAVAKADKSDRAVRVLYLGDGAPSIGARTPASLESGARAVFSALEGRATLTTVAIGVDSDATSLEALARGGGGTLVRHVAGRKIGAAALGILETTYGATLRDVTIALPDGLESIAPAKLGSIAAGDETTVVARMKAKEISGTATIAGTLGGKPWSQSIPIAVHASSESANAFVPRVFASETIADLDRLPNDAEKAKIVQLSKTFFVPSRHTSLIVLENAAMSAAFGVERLARPESWTSAPAEVKPAETKAAPTVMAPTGPADSKEKEQDTKLAPDAPCVWATTGGGVTTPYMPMRLAGYRKHNYCQPTFANDGTQASDLEARLEAARAAAKAMPGARDKLIDVWSLAARRESLGFAQQLLGAWTLASPMDPDALLRRAELAARDGEHVRALRIATGVLDARPDDLELADGLALAATRAGESQLACSLRAVRAEMRPDDIDALARRVSCVRALGREEEATRILSSLDAKKRSALDAQLVALAKETPSSTSPQGDLLVAAKWTAPAAVDLDITIVDPMGARYSWISPSRVRVMDDASTAREAIALSGASAGSYTIEIARKKGASADLPLVTGAVFIAVPGRPGKSYPFSLSGVRTSVARVDLKWDTQMIPIYRSFPKPTPRMIDPWYDPAF